MQTILLQDEPELLRALERGILRRSDLRLVLAATSTELLERSRRESPDMVILDHDIPGGASGRLVDALHSLPVPPACLIVESDAAMDVSEIGEPRRAPIQDSICRRLGLAGRGAGRQPLRCATRVLWQGECLHGTTRDISRSGTFVVTRTPLARARKVELQMRALPGRRLTGHVVRSVALSPEQDRLPGMGICFEIEHHLTAAEMETVLSDEAARVQE